MTHGRRQEMAKNTEELSITDAGGGARYGELEQEKECRERELQFETALYCDCPACNFQAMHRSSLVNHQRQSHKTHSMPVLFQGLHNHKYNCIF